MILPSSTLKVSGLSLAFQPVRSLPLKSDVKPSSLSWTKANINVAMIRCFTDRSPLKFGAGGRPYITPRARSVAPKSNLRTRPRAFLRGLEDLHALELHDAVVAPQAGHGRIPEGPAGIGRRRR